MRLEVETNISEVISKLAKYGEDVQDDLEDLINDSLLNVETKAKQNLQQTNPRTGKPTSNIGRLSGSISIERVKDKKTPFGSVEVRSRYGPYVEFGTKARADIPAGLEGYASQFKGGGGSFEDLEQNLKRWAHLRGFDEEIVYPLAVRIAREGVNAQPFLFPAWESERRPFIQKLKRMIEQNASTQ